MIHKQSFPPPHPLLPQNPPLLPQQQLNKMMIQRIELHPPSLHPHPPQFVAAKSLMLNPPNFSYTVSYVTEENVLQFLKNNMGIEIDQDDAESQRTQEDEDGICNDRRAG